MSHPFSIKHLLLVLPFAVAIAGCSLNGTKPEKTTKLLVTEPLQADTAVTREYVAQIRSASHIELRALERGYLEKIFVDEGQLVRKGQLMFQINPLLYQAEYQKAVAEAEYAEIEFQNTQKLAEANVVSPNELALAKAKLNKAKAECTLAKTHVDFTQIRAPFEGIMDKFHVRVGSLLEEGELLTTLSDNSRMWVYFNVPEAEYLSYQKSKDNGPMRVTMRLANHEIFDQPGKVETIEADFNNETGNIAFRATFPNPKRLLRHGETGNILIRILLPNALIIPQKATFEVLEKKYVFVVDESSRVRARVITIAAEMPDLYVVGSGLKPGEKILLEGINKVHDGDHITFNFRKPEAAMRDLHLYAE